MREDPPSKIMSIFAALIILFVVLFVGLVVLVFIASTVLTNL